MELAGISETVFDISQTLQVKQVNIHVLSPGQIIVFDPQNDVLFNKTKNSCVGLFIYMSSTCMQLFTAFKLAF